ncbi:MAG: hypothetical protein ACRCXD_00680, partial [Luteolibacter sp.]
DAKKAERGDSYVTAMTEVLGVMGWFDPENQGLLEEFQTLKSAALRGEPGKEEEMEAKANEIAARGMELENIVGMERRQYYRQKEQKAKTSATRA